MKTVLITILALASIHENQASKITNKRGSLRFYNDDLVLSQTDWKQSHIPLQEAADILPGEIIAIPNLNPVEYTLNGYNSVEKPVDEPQELVPSQSFGTAVIPPMPPPATPVNAVAANVPASNGAVFLGSGSLGVVSLGNGAYALGSGSLGYSMNRAQPRPSSTAPLYPPLPANPNLVPAAVPTGPPPPPPQHNIPLLPSNTIDFNHPLLNNPEGYEFLSPNRVAFGMPLPRLPRLRTTQQYATPTSLLVRPNMQYQAPAPIFQLHFPVGHQPPTIG